MVFFLLVRHFHFLLSQLPTYCERKFSVKNNIGHEQGDIFMYVFTEMSFILNKKPSTLKYDSLF